MPVFYCLKAIGKGGMAGFLFTAVQWIIKTSKKLKTANEKATNSAIINRHNMVL